MRKNGGLIVMFFFFLLLLLVLSHNYSESFDWRAVPIFRHSDDDLSRQFNCVASIIAAAAAPKRKASISVRVEHYIYSTLCVASSSIHSSKRKREMPLATIQIALQQLFSFALSYFFFFPSYTLPPYRKDKRRRRRCVNPSLFLVWVLRQAATARSILMSIILQSKLICEKDE